MTPGWDVAARYAHYSIFPLFMSAAPPLPDGPIGEPVTAVEIRRFNAPDEVVSDAAAHELIEAATGRSTHSPLPVLR